MTISVELRPLHIDDAPALSRLADNPKVSQFLRDYFPSPYTVKDAEEFIPMTLTKDPLENFGVIYNDTFCGICGAHPYSDIHRHTAEIGYWIGEPYWGKGIMTKAMSHLIKYCFEEAQYTRIQAITFENNIGSMRILEKNGFVKEGVMRKHVIKAGQYYDAPLYSLIDSDYDRLTSNNA